MNRYRSLFRNRNYVWLWLGGTVSNIGDFFNSLALLKILSQDPDHLGFYLALIMVAKTLPGVLLGPVAGVLADRLNRRSIMIAADLLRAGLVAGLVFAPTPAALIALVSLSAAVSACFNPAHTALLPSLVAEEELLSATSLAFVTQRAAQLVGNALGAAVLLFLSPHQVFYVDAASFLISALLTLPIRPPAGRPAAPAAEPFFAKFAADVREAAGFLREAPPVRRLLATFGIVAVGDAALNVLLFPFLITGLGLAAEHYGFVAALVGGVAVGAGLVMGALGNRIHWRHLISVGCLAIFAAIFGSLVIHRLVPSIALLLSVGLGSASVNVGASAAYGTLVPDHVRGRIAGAWAMMQNGIYVAGVLAAGALSDRLGVIPVLLGFTIFYLLTGLYAMWAFRSLDREGGDYRSPCEL